jgi:hypothetical protein
MRYSGSYGKRRQIFNVQCLLLYGLIWLFCTYFLYLYYTLIIDKYNITLFMILTAFLTHLEIVMQYLILFFM